MKNRIYSVLLALSLASSCAKESDDHKSPAGVPSAAPVVAGEGATKPRLIAKPMFARYEPGFAYHLRSDKTTPNRSGVAVRRVTLEYIGADQEEVEQLISAELSMFGYKAHSPSVENGVRTIRFVKKDFPRVGVMFSPITERSKPQADGARGFVRFIWKPTRNMASD